MAGRDGRGDGAHEPAKSARTRTKLLDAAAYVLKQEGYAGTRLSDIAERAQVQAPALYYYFASRDELIEEVLTRGINRTIDHVRTALDGMSADSAAMDRICAAVGAHLEVGLYMSDYAAATIRNSTQLPAEMRERQLVRHHEYSQIWRELFDEARRTGELDPELDLRKARLLVLGALNWTPEWWTPDSGSLHSLIATAQQLVRRGLSAGADSPLRSEQATAR